MSEEQDPYFEITADEENNRLHMNLVGMLSEDQARQTVEEVKEKVQALDAGFGVINDISEFKPISQEATEYIEKGKQLLVKEDASAVVRVTGESVIGKMQFDRHGDDENAYHVATAETIEDAKELLDEFTKGNTGDRDD